MSLKSQVQKEYMQGFEHIRSEITKKDNILKQLIPTVENGEIKIQLLKKNIDLENALFSSDTVEVMFWSSEWELWSEKTENMSKAQKFDYDDTDMDEDDEEIRMLNWLYWAAVRLPVWYDEVEQQPITTVVNPLNCVPDPKNWQGSKMRFFWFRRRISVEQLTNDKTFNEEEVIKLKGLIDQELGQRERAINNANDNQHILDQDGLIDIYDHRTVYKGKKLYTTWAANRAVELRRVELEPVTEAETIKQSKIDFGITIYRRKPKYWAFMWISIADEVLQFQDPISKLYELMNINANIQARWSDILVSDELDIDVGLLSSTPAWGRYVPYSAEWIEWQSIQTKAFELPKTWDVAQSTQSVIAQLENLASDWKGLAFWSSPTWSQTKSETQTLMQNINVQLSQIGSNYIKWDKNFWKHYFRMYRTHMLKWATKQITYFWWAKTFNQTLKKEDFVPEGKIILSLKSKREELSKNDKEFAKLQAMAWFILQNTKQGSLAQNKYLRKLIESSNVEDIDASDYITLTRDERIAYERVPLLNKWLEVGKPQPWEDYETHIEIYKTCVPTEERDNLIRKYQEALISQPEQATQMGATDATSSAMAWNQVNSQLSAWNSAPSLQDIQM